MEAQGELLNYSILLLKPGGRLLIETPNAVALAKRLKVLFGKSNQVNANFFTGILGSTEITLENIPNLN